MTDTLSGGCAVDILSEKIDKARNPLLRRRPSLCGLSQSLCVCVEISLHGASYANANEHEMHTQRRLKHILKKWNQVLITLLLRFCRLPKRTAMDF